MNYSQKKINYLIIFSLVISSILSFYYINKYDDYSQYKNKKHPMIKVSIQNGWYEANKIIKDYKNGESFLKSGGTRFDEYLPPKIIAVYFLFSDHDIYEGELIKTNNGKLSMLLFKTFFYYLSLYFLSLIIAKNFSVRLSFYTILFLSLMPDIMQYHSSFWNETYFFPFQIMTIYY